MFGEILKTIFTLGIYPLIKKGRKTKLVKRTKKYREDGTLRKDVILEFDTDEDECEAE